MESTERVEIKRMGIARRITNFREFNLILIIILIGVVLSIATPSFLTSSNLRAVAVSFALDCIVVIGMSLTIISGGIDLSVGAVLSLSCALTAVLFQTGLPFVVCALAGMLASLGCGVFNGFLIAKQKMAPFIVTLAMMSIARGIGFVLTTGSPISLVNKLPPAFKYLGSGVLAGFPVVVLISVVLVIIADVLFRRSPLLRLVYYSGSNEKAAVFSGLNVPKIKFLGYVVTALLCGVAGLLFLSRFSYSSPVAGMGLELTMIAGCVIGGISMEGGEGTVLGSVLGVILLSLINNGLILLSVSVYWQQFIGGCILITAVWLDYYRNRGRSKK
jgi:ribose transport system permease protein